MLAQDGVIITASARAARHLLGVNQAEKLRAGKSAWRSPKILSLDAWLEEAWQTLVINGAEDRLLLSSLAAEQIWLAVLRDDGAAAQVLTERGLAQAVSEAWRLLWSYGDMRSLRAAGGFGDALAFAGWAERFFRLSEQKKWMDPARLPDAITQAIVKGRVPLPPAILFCGFDRITPALQRLVAAVRARGCDVHIEAFASKSEHVFSASTFVEAPNQTTELETIASWARNAIAATPSIQIALVVPDVSTMRDEIENILRRVLAAETRSIFADDSALPYEFSLGLPLAEYSLIRCALLLLHWSSQPLLIDNISWLLNCRYCGEDDVWTRARADAELRRRGRSLRLEADMSWAIKALSSSDSKWRNKLQELQRSAAQLHLNRPAERARYSAWIEGVEKYLDSAGWPGSATLDSVEYQTQKRWRSVLLSVARLDACLPKVSFIDVLEMLERECQSSIFSPESHDAPIQIIGAAESAGLSADAVWFVGVDEMAWPIPQRSNPLLPAHLQLALKMPGADSRADFLFATQVSLRISACAPTVFASFARRKEEAELNASAALTEIKWTEKILAHQMPQPVPDTVLVETEPLLDRSHVPWTEATPAGGAEVLEYQADCPFRAFALKRLRAQTLSEIEEGLGYGDRGNLVHTIMQRFWSEVVEQRNLLAMDEHTSLALLGKHIASALIKHAEDDQWSAAFLAAESARLSKVLSSWLQTERERVNFSVAEKEKELEKAVGPLRLSLRMDRVDHTAAGDVILDYKTGNVSTRDWDGERPKHPQLPIYALNMPALAGLAFARISVKQICMTGWQREDGVFFTTGDDRNKVMTQPLDQRLAEWRGVLARLAEEFATGEARVDPARGSETCRHCGLEVLCRIAEAQTGLEEECETEE